MNQAPGAFAQPPAPFACRPEESRGRRHPEAESATRSVFQRDCDRIIHSAAFRRLKHKTQVFVYHEGDNYRTRLSHSLEVSQIARSISRVLGLNEDLAEALALAHDLGHPPFGHAGEEALDAAMQPWGGFDHNAQTLSVLTRLEHRYAEFDGLNLTWETLEGVVKHNGPLLAAGQTAAKIPPGIAEYVAQHDLELASYAGAEAQVAALADDIAYNNHDIDDGLRAELFAIEDLAQVPLVGPLFAEVLERYPGLERSRLIHETIRRMITRMVDDAIAETGRRIAAEQPGHALDVRALGRPLVAHSRELAEESRSLREFLFQNMYRHYRINRMASKGRRIVSDLFALYLAEPECLPTDWRGQAGEAGSATTARLACDFIAGMTDRFAADEHNQLFDVYSNK